MTGPTWLRWPTSGRLVRERTFCRMRWEPRSPVAAIRRLQAEAAMHRNGAGGWDPAVGGTRRGHGPAGQHARRMLEAVVLLGPDIAPAEGWGG